MAEELVFSIGELARRTGLSVKTVRFYSDEGLVPPARRTDAGHRLYDVRALAKVELVRTLRDLGVDLATVRRLLERGVTLPEIAAVHAEALDAQIRTLRLRRAVLRAVARRGSDPEELKIMHDLARSSAEERNAIIHEFIDATFRGLDGNPAFVAMMRSAMPELPDDPEPEQVEAWIELADLVRDEDFRASVRRMAELQAENDETELHQELTRVVAEKVGAALAAGIAPGSPEAAPVVDGLLARYAETFGAEDSPEYRRSVMRRLEVADDPRAARYWALLGKINGWPEQPDMAPVMDWFTAALRARLDG
ncbi:MerR family transcriptional regulator [Actinomadura logoneensis]|uniref:MerR family transcriptional regulator n=1 Tax=Actinomadura logoneensis TaxID=2293572 RepID=A0A372JAG3_9ACTN|nr:MerR family transcriptional regulator [Actinomadura logoneensis]RFU36993.1 MerR family transcriptional regulator [Actinomadura logoneensis]